MTLVGRVGDFDTPSLAKLVARQDLTASEVEAVASHILRGDATDIEIAAFIVALRTKGETVEELSALVRTMLGFSVAVSVAPGAIDTCGTGGDRSGTINVSTIGAIVAAGAGVRVVKHGNRAASSQCGSADVLEALGIPIELGPESVARCVQEAGIGFCFAPRYHPALRFIGPVRRALGVPTTFNFLGPLANPARVLRQCVGVSDPLMAQRVTDVLVANGAEHVMVFCGRDGLDELTTTTTSHVIEYRDGATRQYELDATTLGIERVDGDALQGGDAAFNASVVQRVLDGEAGAARNISILNAAAAIQVAGLASTWPDGIELASHSIDSGGASKTFDAWRTLGRTLEDSPNDKEAE